MRCNNQEVKGQTTENSFGGINCTTLVVFILCIRQNAQYKTIELHGILYPIMQCTLPNSQFLEKIILKKLKTKIKYIVVTLKRTKLK